MTVPAPASGFERKEAVLIINPAAHNVPALKLRREAEDWLREAGWRFRWEQTTETGHATRIAARAAAQKIPLVLALGGDGTLNEVANGLAGSETALGTLPAGTSNIWAREAGISRKLVEAVRLMATGERRLIDLGKAGDRYFMLFAGIGVDAQITRNVSLDMKRRVGAAAYGVAAFREALRWRSRPVTLRLDGVERRMNVLMAFAGNTRLYAERDLERLELILSLTRELGVNLAGVEVILRLVQRMGEMQNEMEKLESEIKRLGGK